MTAAAPLGYQAVRAAQARPLQETARTLQRTLIRLARQDVNTFNSYVLRDEKTGKPIRQAAYHEGMQRECDEHDRLVLWAHVEGGKSTQLTVGRGLWELGKDPGLRTVIVSATAKQSGKVCRAMARYIETSQALRRVFPRLVKSEPWWPSQALTVERPFVSKDPSVQAIGVHGNILGARIDRAYLDDILSHENVRTEAQRIEVYDWFMSTISGRISEAGRVYFVGQAWHPGDIMHRLEKEGWHAVRYPVVDAFGNLAWPERWGLKRVNKFKRYGMLEYNRQLLCIARDDAESRFKLEWIELCKERGDGLGTMHSLAEIPEGCAIYTGVDLAVQRHSGADLTVLFTVLVHPNGDRQVLNVESGRWAAGDIISKIVSVYVRFGGIIIVENNGAQQYILDLTREVTAATIRPFTTGKNKAHPEFGVESLAAELEAGKWIIPNDGGVCEPEVDRWISGMLSYDPQKHTPDHVMAAWFAREGARSWERVLRGEEPGVRARIVG